jgi:hypothetical protein
MRDRCGLLKATPFEGRRVQRLSRIPTEKPIFLVGPSWGGGSCAQRSAKAAVYLLQGREALKCLGRGNCPLTQP